MTMATISPSGREVSPAGRPCRSSRLVLLKFRLVAAANPPKSLLLIFFWNETLLVAKEGARGPAGGPQAPQAWPGG